MEGCLCFLHNVVVQMSLLMFQFSEYSLGVSDSGCGKTGTDLWFKALKTHIPFLHGTHHWPVSNPSGRPQKVSSPCWGIVTKRHPMLLAAAALTLPLWDKNGS